MTSNINFKDYRYIFVLMCFLIPGTEAFINSIISIYLSEQMHFNASKIATYFVAYPLAYVFIVQLIAKISDKGVKRSHCIAFAALAGVLANIIFFIHANEITFFLTVVPLYAIAQSAYSQIFALSREYALDNLPSAMRFSTFMRALASLAWVIIPTFGFYLINHGMFNLIFVFCACTYIVIALVALFVLPNSKTNTVKATKVNTEIQPSQSILKDKNVMLLCLSVIGMFTAFSTYYNTMPLFVIKQLNLSPQLPGTMFSISAFFEIPFMLASPFIAKRIGIKNVVGIGVVAIAIFLFSLQFVTKPYQILSLAVFPALYIATVCPMGMIYFQELLKKIPGQATSLFFVSMTAGFVIGGSLISLADNNYFSNIHAYGTVIACLSVLILFFVRKPQEIN